MQKTLSFSLGAVFAAALVAFAAPPLAARLDLARIASGRKPIFCRLAGQDIQGHPWYQGLGYGILAWDFLASVKPSIYDRTVSVSFRFPFPKRWDYSIVPPPRPARLSEAEALQIATTAARRDWPDFAESWPMTSHYDPTWGGTWCFSWKFNQGSDAQDASAYALCEVTDKTGRATPFPRYGRYARPSN